jgi:hypothetical protein
MKSIYANQEKNQFVQIGTNKPWAIHTQKTHNDLDLGGVTILLLIVYFLPNDGDYIEMEKSCKILTWDSQNYQTICILFLCKFTTFSYEF